MFDGEAIAKTFTRYVVPGLIFIFLALIAPLSLVEPTLFFGKEPFVGATQVIILSVLTGYVLDAIKGYRWTLSWRAYKDERFNLGNKLEELLGRKGANPDYQLTTLWLKDEALYNRIFLERAEWVMILETAFSLLLSSVSLIAVGVYLQLRTNAPGWPMWLAAPALVAVSILASRNGIDRMKAHNAKVVEAIKDMVQEGKANDTSTPPSK